MGTLLIRADAGVRIGSGHVMRCLALAQAWQEDGGDVVLLSSPEIGPMSARLEKEGVRIRILQDPPGSQADVSTTESLLRECSAEWAVVDGYAFTAEYQDQLRRAGHRFLFIDDGTGDPSRAADLTLRPGLAEREVREGNSSGAGTVLEGGRHLLLRKEFHSWRSWTREIPETAARILVTMGGSDPDNRAMLVVEALELCRTPSWEATLLLGPSNPHEAAVRARIEAHRLPIRLLRGLEDMAPLMSSVDLAVSAAGSTCWELAFMGLPALLLIVADNQRPVAQSMQRAGLGVSLGEAAGLDPARLAVEIDRLTGDFGLRSEMSRKARILVDGNGARRVVARMRSELLTLREARPEDVRVVWEWANDPEIRSVSFSPEPIPWEHHQEWFRRKLDGAQCVYFIVTETSGRPVGQIRFDLTGREAVVSISLSREFRRRGWGASLLERACRRLGEKASVDVIHAYIKETNQISERAFERAGFVRRGAASVQHQQASHWILPKESLR